MKFDCRQRGAGKTHDLIKLVAEKYPDAVILCEHQGSVRNITEMARDMGMNILQPITIDEWMRGKMKGLGIRQVFIEDADKILEHILHVWLQNSSGGVVEIAGVTLSNSVGLPLPQRVNNPASLMGFRRIFPAKLSRKFG